MNTTRLVLTFTRGTIRTTTRFECSTDPHAQLSAKIVAEMGGISTHAAECAVDCLLNQLSPGTSATYLGFAGYVIDLHSENCPEQLHSTLRPFSHDGPDMQIIECATCETTYAAPADETSRACIACRPAAEEDFALAWCSPAMPLSDWDSTREEAIDNGSLVAVANGDDPTTSPAPHVEFMSW